MLKNNLLVLVLVLYSSFAFAQIKVSGVVTSQKDNSPMIGVSVFVQGTTTGVQTDLDGKYSIDVKKGETLIFSFIGYTQKQVIVEDSQVNVSLSESEEVLGDVVVTALGIKKSQKSLGYTQTTLDADQLTSTNETDVATSVAGKISGVQILGGVGSTFRESQIRVRGVNSLTGTAKAVYVVDDIFVDSDDVNMDDIQTLTILKGPAATAAYGSRGANGVVIITTKSGKGAIPGWGIEVKQLQLLELL